MRDAPGTFGDSIFVLCIIYIYIIVLGERNLWKYAIWSRHFPSENRKNGVANSRCTSHRNSRCTSHRKHHPACLTAQLRHAEWHEFPQDAQLQRPSQECIVTIVIWCLAGEVGLNLDNLDGRFDIFDISEFNGRSDKAWWRDIFNKLRIIYLTAHHQI